METEVDFDTLKGGGDCLLHYHNTDKFPSRDSMLWFQDLERVKNIAANYTLTSDDDIIKVTTTPVTITLPRSRGGKRYTVLNIASGVVTITPNGTETISGAANITIVGVRSVSVLKAVTGGWIDLINGMKASTVSNVPAGNIAATTVQAALNELDVEKALLAGSATQNFAMNFGTAAASFTATGGFKTGEAANSKQGTAVLVAGAVVVANTSITANSRIFLTSQVDGGTVGFLRTSARVVGTSFTITSSSLLDTSTVAFEIFEPA